MEDWKNITTYEDALEATKSMSDDLLCDHLGAICRIDVIRRALNKDYNPSLIKGIIYYPFVRFFESEKAKDRFQRNILVECGKVEIEGKLYDVVGGGFGTYELGLSDFMYGYGEVMPSLALLGCKSKEIARHMSTYFAKDIFEACYGHLGNYKWIEIEK